MANSIQADTYRCPNCEKAARVTAGDNPWVFDWVCTCGACGVIAWDEDRPAPAFASQAKLFDDGPSAA